MAIGPYKEKPDPLTYLFLILFFLIFVALCYQILNDRESIEASVKPLPGYEHLERLGK